MNNIGIWGALFGVGIFLLVGKYVILRRMRRAEKQVQAPLPMPGMGTTPKLGEMKVSVHVITFPDNPEWARELFEEPPTHAELQESLFAEIERLGIKIPE